MKTDSRKVVRIRRSRLRGRVRGRVLAVMLLFLVFGITWLLIAINTNPSWYQPPDPRDERVVQLGHDTQNRIITETHQVRLDYPTWSISLKGDEINAWMMVNLAGWLEHETGRIWPAEISPPMVSIVADAIYVGLKAPHRFGDRVLAVRLRPKWIDDDDEHPSAREVQEPPLLGTLTLQDGSAFFPEDFDFGPSYRTQDALDDADAEDPVDSAGGEPVYDAPPPPRRLVLMVERVSLGRVSIPTSAAGSLIDAIREVASPYVDLSAFDYTVRMLLDEQPVHPELLLGDGRRVRLVDLRLEPGEALLTCVTEPPLDETAGSQGRRAQARPRE